MTRLLTFLRSILTSRATSPLVIGFFFLVYIGIAFFTDEALTTLIGLTSGSLLLAAVFALLPASSAGRFTTELMAFGRKRKALAGQAVEGVAALFDEEVVLPGEHELAGTERRLAGLGYRTRRTESSLFAWRGFSALPVRLLFLAGTCCLYAGILISLTSRASLRGVVVEGEELPGMGAMVKRISFEHVDGPILSDSLLMTVGGAGEPETTFGLYPPGSYRGAFVYPRYLGVGLLVRLTAPDLPGGFQKNCVLAVYPPGKEASVEVPDTTYRLTFSLKQPEDGSDPYRTGRMTFLFKLTKGEQLLFSDSVPVGREFVRDGYRLALPDARRLVITDFVRDVGVPLIWGAFLLFGAAFLLWLPVRLLLPRREMLFLAVADRVASYSLAEGRRKGHEGIYRETLDLMESGREERAPRQDTLA